MTLFSTLVALRRRLTHRTSIHLTKASANEQRVLVLRQRAAQRISRLHTVTVSTVFRQAIDGRVVLPTFHRPLLPR